jgi:hypothetical protein
MNAELFDHVETTEETIGAKLRQLCLPDRFNHSWSAVTTVREARHDELGWMVREHYLGCWPAIVAAKFVAVAGGIKCGAVIYAHPPKETLVRYGGNTLELARVWMHDALPRNTETWVIAKTLRILRRMRPDLIAVVSYADPSRGHEGAIYRAGNWKMDGMTEEERKTPRCDYLDERGVLCSRFSRPNQDAIRVPRHSKHRYVWFYSRRGS